MIAAAALCPAPPLLARELTGQADVVPELRAACAAAVRRLVATAPDEIVIVGPGELTATWTGDDRVNLAVYAPALALRSAPDSDKSAAADGQPELPLSLVLGARLLAEAGYLGPRGLWSVTGSAPPDECARIGRDLAAPAERVALLVMGDGSARRSVSAPGYLDERAGPFDAEVERAVRDLDLDALAALDPALAADLLVSGRPAWQVLAAALGATRSGAAPGSAGGRAAGGGLRPEILYSGAPFGVGYLVAVLTG